MFVNVDFVTQFVKIFVKEPPKAPKQDARVVYIAAAAISIASSVVVTTIVMRGESIKVLTPPQNDLESDLMISPFSLVSMEDVLGEELKTPSPISPQTSEKLLVLDSKIDCSSACFKSLDEDDQWGGSFFSEESMFDREKCGSFKRINPSSLPSTFSSRAFR